MSISVTESPKEEEQANASHLPNHKFFFHNPSVTNRANLKTGVLRKQNTPNFPKNKHFLPPDTYTHVCISGGKKCLFVGKFGVLCFHETPVLRFALLPCYRRIQHRQYFRRKVVFKTRAVL